MPGPLSHLDRPRPLARARRAVVHAAPRRPRRDRHQDRAAGHRRRHARAGVRRISRTPTGRDTSEAAYYLACNRGKLSVAVDFTHARRAGDRPRSRARRPTCSSRTSRSAASRNTASTTRASRAVNPRLVYCVDHRLRPGRPVRRSRRLRLHHPGHERLHERHRRARRSARRRPAEGGRRDHRPHDRHVRDRRDPGRARASRPHRARASGSTRACSIPRSR